MHASVGTSHIRLKERIVGKRDTSLRTRAGLDKTSAMLEQGSTAIQNYGWLVQGAIYNSS